MSMADREYNGLLCIGDPHLCTRAPGWRKDDYPRTILAKLRWSLEQAREQGLLVLLLGDLFHLPRDMTNQFLVELLGILVEPILAIAGNHDCHENVLSDGDTLSVLEAAGRIRLLDQDRPWKGCIGGTTVIVGGTCWGGRIPASFDSSPHAVPGRRTRVFWVTHHDVRFPGYEEAGRFGCSEIPGVDAVINGHIHRVLPDVRAGCTTWINPGNISRISRSDATRQHTPAVLRIVIDHGEWSAQRIPVPHADFDDVFHRQIDAAPAPTARSGFVCELAALEHARTACGAGLAEFLDANLAQFDPEVSEEIRRLAKEELAHDN
jgi:predicted phosphodiesterase